MIVVAAILTDIEGTTSSISFVKEVLFPYAARALPDYIRDHIDTPEVAEQVRAVRESIGLGASLDVVIAALLGWIEEDRKVTPLKALQGMIWESGYRNGDYGAHVYPDAHAALTRWHHAGIPLYVYSSGSVAAQKLFFAHSDLGDMTPLFRGYFDTTSGPKQHISSYRTIADAVGLPAQEILFLSDVVAELDAARGAGMLTCWVVRERDTTASADEIAASAHPTATSLCDIPLGGNIH